MRNIYVGLAAANWIKNELRKVRSDGYFHGSLKPTEQLVDTFRRLMQGEPMNDLPPKTLRPRDAGLHELRTPDLRIFGWFWRSHTYIVGSACAVSTLKTKDTVYAGHMETCRFFREGLDLDEPKFISGEVDDILESRNR